MNIDVDRDDPLGQRILALRSWEPRIPDDDVWHHIQHRYRRRRTRRTISGAVVVAVVISAIGLVVGQSSTNGQRVAVVGPNTPSGQALAQLLQPAPIGPLDVAPSGPYHAGQRLRFSYKPTPSGPAYAAHAHVTVCYPWDGGETCDPTIQSRYVSTDKKTRLSTYTLTVAGWVYTPTGLQTCNALRCRFEIQTGNGNWVGTPPVDIAPGPEPQSVAHIISIDHNTPTMQVAFGALQPDPTWTRWSAHETPTTIAKLPPGGLTVCAFGAQLLCDGLVQPAPPPFDGRPHQLTVTTNRLLFTTKGWIDCEKVVCVLALTRTVNVELSSTPVNYASLVRTIGRDSQGRFTLADTETVAILPYQLPSTIPTMREPTLTYTPNGPFQLGDTVTATLHNPPPNINPDTQLILGACSDMCDSADTQHWTTLANGSLQQQYVLNAAAPGGTTLSVGLSGFAFRLYPAIALTHQFHVTLTPAEQQQVNANLRRLHLKPAKIP